jgi:hypothetical protein
MEITFFYCLGFELVRNVYQKSLYLETAKSPAGSWQANWGASNVFSSAV